jgi:FlaA1/EpsC-like NDP-sugar epimerase
MLTKTIQSILDLKRYWRFARSIQKGIDILLLVAAFTTSYLLRFEFFLDQKAKNALLIQLSLAIPLQFLLLYLMGVYRTIWRYTSIPEILRIIYCFAGTSLILLTGRLLFADSINILAIPFSIIIMDFVLSVVALLGVRITRRIFYEEHQKRKVSPSNKKSKNVLLIGAGRAGVRTIAEIKGRGDINLNVKGFIDDDDFKQKSVIHGVKVIGKSPDLPRLVKELSIDHVVLSVAQSSRENIRRILDICEKIPVKVRTIPGLYELIQGDITFSRIRDLQIEDLLGRPTIELDKDSIDKYLSNKTIAVTGAGGSIGSELVKQVASCEPKKILLIERSEFALFKIEQEILRSFPEAKIVPLIADITDELRLKAIFKQYRPAVVFHAAAHKHVPLMEQNPVEAVRNNIIGTLITGKVAGECEVESFILISSDKAVNPTSVMGATKRAAELVTISLDRKYDTRYISVRFGNVIGSTGSVIPIFQEQIKTGGPVTVTHPEMTRYFMTIPEATQLVLQAGAIGTGGEIFVLDMGEPIKIYDLALDTIRLSGLEPEKDIKIVFTGVRPGEKLAEILQGEAESLTKTRHSKIFIGKNQSVLNGEIWEAVKELKSMCESAQELDSDQQIINYLNKLLPEANLSSASKAAYAIADSITKTNNTIG